ncbi:MAG: flippase-like domain-containing protein [Bacteroidetes bacterium]|nr:flippase-like domain-containing protein [Bacteroidota bacterium]
MQLRREEIRRWAPWAGKLLLAAVLIAFLMKSLEGNAIASVLARANPLLITAAVLLLPINLFFQYQKWRLLVRSRFPFVSPGDVSSSLLLGFTLGIVTPARIGEFGGRAAGIRNRNPRTAAATNGRDEKGVLTATDRMTLVGLTAVDKLATMAVTVLVGCCGLLLFCWRHPFMNPVILTAILLGIVISAAVFLRFRWRAAVPRTDPAADAANSTRHDGFLRRRIGDIRRLLRGLDAPLLRALLLLSLLFYLTFLLQFFLLLSAFGPVDTLTALTGISTIMLLKTVIPPVTIGELGIREGASVFVLGHAGILAAAAFNASLLLFAINIFLPSIAGLTVLFRAPRSEVRPPLEAMQ